MLPEDQNPDDQNPAGGSPRPDPPPAGGRRLQPGTGAYEGELEAVRSEAASYRRRNRDLNTEMQALEAQHRAKSAEWSAKETQYKADIETRDRRIAELEPLQTEMEAIRTARRTELLERLPEKIRAEYQADGITIEELERVARIQGVIPKSPGTSPAVHTPTDEPPAKSPTEMSTAELAAMKAADPTAYQAAIKAINQARATTKSPFGI